jgi:hypothetical protein
MNRTFYALKLREQELKDATDGGTYGVFPLKGSGVMYRIVHGAWNYDLIRDSDNLKVVSGRWLEDIAIAVMILEGDEVPDYKEEFERIRGMMILKGEGES